MAKSVEYPFDRPVGVDFIAEVTPSTVLPSAKYWVLIALTLSVATACIVSNSLLNTRLNPGS